MTNQLFPILPRQRFRRRLDNGLSVLVVSVPDTAVVSSCLWYSFGAADEGPDEFGGAHFLEHMMFKGSADYGPGDVDRLTQSLGGENNAFTSQDATAYYFKFSPPHWRQGLAIEADRMRGLTLDPVEVASERKVILEELAMVEADPWEALDQAVVSRLFAGHPYGRPILGTRQSLAGLGADELRSLHRCHYRPDQAVLVLAGGVDASALDEVERRFGAIEASTAPTEREDPPSAAAHTSRIECHRGRVPRFLLALPGPSADDAAAPPLRLACGVLSGGRSSRLHRILVEDLELCQWVTADLTESRGNGTLTVAAELDPGADGSRVESIVLEELDRLGREPVPRAELARAQRLQTSGWIFAHDQVHDVALSLGLGLALIGDEDLVERQLEATLAVEPDQLTEEVRRGFGQPHVVGWSWPDAEEADG